MLPPPLTDFLARLRALWNLPNQITPNNGDQPTS